jgi:hypothetical protein
VNRIICLCGTVLLFAATKTGVLAQDQAGASDASSAQQTAPASDDGLELAKKLSNPVASLISVPFQSNFDFGMGNGSGWRYTMNFQPVVPVALNSEWNIISRTILPVIHQHNVAGIGTQSGLGDTEKFGVGPTFLALRPEHAWTYGALTNHIWSVAGSDDRASVNSTFIQPFLAYNTRDAWTYTVNAEMSYDWNVNHWSVPVHLTISKLVRFGRHPVSFGGALRCWATSPAGGPENCGFRFIVTRCFLGRALLVRFYAAYGPYGVAGGWAAYGPRIGTLRGAASPGGLYAT